MMTVLYGAVELTHFVLYGIILSLSRRCQAVP